MLQQTVGGWNAGSTCHPLHLCCIQCAYNDKADASAKQAAATHPLQLWPCVLRRPGEPLAPSGSRKVRPKGDAVGVDEHQPVSASQQPGGTLCKPREPLAPSSSRNVRPKRSTQRPQQQSPISVSQQAQSMHPGDGRRREKYLACRALPYGKISRQEFVHADQARGYNSHVGPQATVLSGYHRRPVNGLNLRSVAFSCVLHPVVGFLETCHRSYWGPRIILHSISPASASTAHAGVTVEQMAVGGSPTLSFTSAPLALACHPQAIPHGGQQCLCSPQLHLRSTKRQALTLVPCPHTFLSGDSPAQAFPHPCT